MRFCQTDFRRKLSMEARVYGAFHFLLLLFSSFNKIRQNLCLVLMLITRNTVIIISHSMRKEKCIQCIQMEGKLSEVCYKTTIYGQSVFNFRSVTLHLHMIQV